jgi:hypothetical protein
MLVHETHVEQRNAITYSPYYGCQIRVLSKANVTYEGVLDGISTKKDRIFMRNVRVKGNVTDGAYEIIVFSPVEQNGLF